MKEIHPFCEQNVVFLHAKPGGTNGNQWVLKGQP
jgi:hypothetical protein